MAHANVSTVAPVISADEKSQQKPEVETVGIFPESYTLLEDMAKLLGEENFPEFVREFIFKHLPTAAKQECRALVNKWMNEVNKYSAKHTDKTREQCVAVLLKNRNAKLVAAVAAEAEKMLETL